MANFIFHSQLFTRISTISLIIPILILTACGTQKIPRNSEGKSQNPTESQVVEVFDLKKQQPELIIKETGITKALKTVEISPEIAGRLQELKVKEGQFVKKGETLAIIGNSLHTAILDLQQDAAERSLEIAEASENTTNFATNQQKQAAALAAIQAQNYYKDSVYNNPQNLELFEEQITSAELAIENSEINLTQSINNKSSVEKILRLLQNQQEDLEDDLFDLRDEIDFLATTEPNYQQLKTQENSLESQIEQLEIQIESQKNQINAAEHSIQQAEITVAQSKNQYQQLKSRQKLQKFQFTQSIYTAFNTYAQAANQVEATQASAKLQALQAETLKINAETGAKVARLQVGHKTIKSPISGYISKIHLDEGNQIVPGQNIFQLVSNQGLKAETSISPEKAALLKLNQTVKVVSEFGELNALISSISKSADENTKKVRIKISILNSEFPCEHQRCKAKQLIPNQVVAINFIPELKSIFLPINALFTEESNTFLKIVKNGKVKTLQVQTGLILGEYIEISSGLIGDELVITSINTVLEENDSVKTS